MNEDLTIAALTALGQPTRLRVFRMLVKAGGQGIAAGAIAEAESIPHNTMSTHLAVLARAGLVRARKDGRSIVYAIDLDGARNFLSYLVSDCCGGHPEFCGPLTEIVEQTGVDVRHVEPLGAGSERVFNVLFLCTANSARSIMAEAILNEVGRGRFRGYSAGSQPAPKPLPTVLERLKTLGHDLAGLRSKSWDEFRAPTAPRMDFVIALCDTLEGQGCPEFGRTVVTSSWPLPDPTKFSGSQSERAAMLNELYASLRRRLEIFTSLPFASLDKRALRARLGDIGGGKVAALERGLAS